MTDQIIVHGFETSNNMKVRVALGYKNLPYEFRTVDPAQREEIVRISGQHLTPVIVHGERVLFDSAAILRYLDANFPATPKIFGTSRDEQWEIEDWEFFARTALAGPLMEVVHHRVAGGTVDASMQARCGAVFAVAANRLAERMTGREWLVGTRMTAADITAAAVMARISRGKLFELPQSVAALHPWVDRVMAFDGPARLPKGKGLAL